MLLVSHADVLRGSSRVPVPLMTSTRTRSAWEARVMSSGTLVSVLKKTNLKLQRFDYLSLIIEHDSHFTRYICFLFNCKTKHAHALT